MDSHQSEVSRALGRLEAGVEGINARLDKLNGSVARHEQRISKLEAVDSAHAAAELATDKANLKWLARVSPLIKYALVFFLALILGHAPQMLKLIGEK